MEQQMELGAKQHLYPNFDMVDNRSMASNDHSSKLAKYRAIGGHGSALGTNSSNVNYLNF